MTGRYGLAMALAGCMLFWGAWAYGGSDDASAPGQPAAESDGEASATSAKVAVQPKPLSEEVRRGLGWLVEHQHENGSWGQGEEAARMGKQPQQPSEAPNVADTCAAALALLRAGNTPGEGPYADSLNRAIAFVCASVEKSEDGTLHVTEMRNTRLQQKLGNYIDTFMASLLLAEVKNLMADDAGTARVTAALQSVTQKIQTHQREDGTWDDRGWANALAHAMCVKAINRSAQMGVPIDEQVLARAEKKAQTKFDGRAATFAAEGSAGVALYASASTLGELRDSDTTNRRKVTSFISDLEPIAAELASSEDQEVAQAATRLRESLENGAQAPAEAAEAVRQLQTAADGKQMIDETSFLTLKKSGLDLDRIATNRVALRGAQQAVVDRLDDKGFIAGFGSNGGEEFLSYLNIGESLVAEGGEAWEKFDKAMTANLAKVQNADGSWTGHHCITGRTFCTAAALLVLTVDRAPTAAPAITAGG